MAKTRSLEVNQISQDLGQTECRLGNYAAGVELLKEAYAWRTQHQNATREELMDDLLKLARATLSAGLLEEAETLYQTAVEAAKNYFSDSDIFYWTAVCGWGYSKSNGDKLVEAEEVQDMVIGQTGRGCKGMTQ
jgi:tetratricopeptide (TPR) repeat protein